MASDAHEEFKSSLRRGVDSLLELHKEAEGSVGRPANWEKTVRRTTLVLLTANLEAFSEGVVAEGLTFLADQNVPAADYPSGIRDYIIYLEYERRRGHFGLADASEMGELQDRWTSSQWTPSVEDLPTDKIEDRFQNPKPPDIDWLMGLLDYEDFVNTRRIQYQYEKMDVRGRLNELCRRRNRIAHGDEHTPEIETVRLMKSLCLSMALQMDRRTREKVEECSGVSPWTPA